MDPRVAYALKIMQTHYGDRLLLDQIAGALALSPSRFRHLFKQETDQTYTGYLRELRLGRAKDSLADWSLSIKQIANQVGYSHARNFVRAFKHRFGKIPSQLRKEIPQPVRRTNSLFGE